MKFTEFRNLLATHFEAMTKNAPRLYTVEVDKDEMWNTYLESFAPEDNPIFKNRREYDCSRCRHFIKNIGNVVAIKDGVVSTIWDFDVSGTIYESVVKKMSDYVKAHRVTGVYLSRFNVVGTEVKHVSLPDGKVMSFDPFFLRLPQQFVFNRFMLNNRGTISEAVGQSRDIRNVYKRSLDEISLDSIDTVLELINSNNL